MKSSRAFALSILCLFLFVTMLFVVTGNRSKLFVTTDSIGSIDLTNKEDIIDEEKIDISDIAYGITDGVDINSLSKIAVNIERVEVLDGLTIEELAKKLNKSLKGVIANKGYLIATKCIKLGIDPYMAVAIMLHETGCNYSCSYLATNYYNVGGMRGSNGWQKFSSIDEGITTFINNLYWNYYKYGLNTPEKINPKYAASTTWATRVRSYMKQIKSK